MKQVTTFLLTTTLLTITALAQDPTEATSPPNVPEPKSAIEKKFEQKTQALEARAQAKKVDFERRGKELEGEAKQPFKLDMTVKWKNRDLSLDLPQVAMQTKEMSMHAPQMTMRTKKVVFHTPSTRMVRRRFGPVVMHVPDVFMQRQEISMDIPEFRWDRTAWSMDIPEIKVDRTNFVMRLPEVRVDEVHFLVPVNNNDLERKSAALKSDADKFVAEMQTEAEKLVSEFTSEQLGAGMAASIKTNEAAIKTALTKQADVVKKYADGIAALDKAIKEGGNKLSPAELKALADEKARMQQELVTLQQPFDALKTALDRAEKPTSAPDA